MPDGLRQQAVGLRTVKLRVLVHIQKFGENDEDNAPGKMPTGGNWRPVEDADGPKLYFQAGSKMNTKPLEDDDATF